MLQADHLADLDAFLIELNRASAEAILPLFRADHGLEDKGGTGGFDPVTEADRGAEAAIRKLIAERYPEHGVIGEEYGEDRPDAEFVWVLDPIDGTRAFISGLPLWTTLVGLRWNGAPVLGSIGQPYLGELFIGSSSGSRLLAQGESRAIRTRACPDMAQAVISTTDPQACFDSPERAVWDDVRRATKLARLGCDAYAYAMVAMGKMDMIVEAGLKAWDVEAAIPLIAGAGGVVTDWRGDEMGKNGGQMLIVGDEALLEPTLELLAPAAKTTL
ncbi:histidinol-phosphatase [Caulobacter sp. NIBR2454]|uniref:histidinol-phosphatase n=1 Tax=Caulobacter sp. NIBR2454 TaxID=3015996 RepID=UPI0022B6128B|nr:histidinol-phosphatase [Caulobacter sp. NIBR2454]